MIDELGKTIHDTEVETLFCKTPGWNNPKKYVLVYNRFNKYMVSPFGDVDKVQICKMPYRDSPHHEIEKLIGFTHLNLFEPNHHTEDEDYHIRKPNDKKFRFQIEDNKTYLRGRKISYFWNKW